MGTNFYWIITGAAVVPDDVKVPVDEESPEVHIGKRSAAGPYCWDCDVTLCKGGEGKIHYTVDKEWLSACPRCGVEATKAAATDALTEGPVAVELGFAKPATQRPTGVRGCSSFTWAQQPAAVEHTCNHAPDMELVRDEYGRKLTGRQFLEMVKANCPVQFTNLIGMRFS